MRRLILLRHAKSDRPAGVADHERPLNDRGRRAAPAVGAHLAEAGIKPDLALVSTATRTQETWEAVAAALGTPEMRSHREIYEAPAERILGVIRGAPDMAQTAAYAVIDFDAATWSAIGPGQGRLERFVRPRDIDPDLGG